MLRAMDPFGATCDPRLYVPRLGSEAALAALGEGFAAGRVMSVLSGPPGLGKTLVLRVFAERLKGAQCAYVPVPSLGIEELAQVALDAFGEPTSGARASVALAAFARRAPDAPVVLLVDDASAMPMPTARALREIADALGGALRVVAAAVDDARSAAAIAALGDDVLHVRLRHPLTPSELRAYVRGRLALAGPEASAPAIREEHFDWLAAESAGVPRVVNTLLTWLQRAGAAPPPRGLLGSAGAPDELAGEPEQLTLWDALGEGAREARGQGGGGPDAGIDPAPPLEGAVDGPGGGPAIPAPASPAISPPRPPRRRRLRRTRGWL